MKTSLLLFVSVCVMGLPGLASAQYLELELWRLGNPRPVTLSDGSVLPDPDLDQEVRLRLMNQANERFRMLMVDLGLAVHPTPGHPANSLGRAGAAVELGLRMPQIHPEAAVTGAPCPRGNPTCSIWVTKASTPGHRQPRYPPSRLLMPTLQARKGLPFSFELGSKIQYLVGSSNFAMTGGLRWALNEGFDFLPDLSMGAQATRLIGTRDFGLTTASADVLIGKWFPIAGTATLAPYLGWQRVWISAVSAVIDFDPANENPSDPTRDDTVFNEVRMNENIYDRVVFGLRARSYIGQVLIEGAYMPAYLGMDPTLSLMVQAGLDF